MTEPRDGEGGGRLGSLPWLTRGGGSETPQIDTWRRDWAAGLSVLGLWEWAFWLLFFGLFLSKMPLL